MLSYHLTSDLLEVQRTFLQPRVHFTVDKDSGIKILLRELAKNLIFRHNSLVKLMNKLKVLFGRVLISENLILHRRALGSIGQESL